jgi:hypothetical protein
MLVIITGGTGFIGRKIAEDLVWARHEVVVLSRNPDRAAGLPREVRVERWDARTAAGWGALADGAGAIINLAGESLAGSSFLPEAWTEERKALLTQSRVDAGAAVVEAVAEARVKPRVVVQISGIGHYGFTGDSLVTEQSAPGVDFLARLTVAWEASTAAVRQHGVRQVVARTGVVLNPNEGALQRLILPFRLFAGGPMGSGKQWFPWIHPDDVSGAMLVLTDDDAADGAFNLVAPRPVTNAAFGKALARALGRPYWLPLPGAALKLVLGEAAVTVLEGQRALPERLLALGYRFRFPTAESALQDLLSTAEEARP